MWPEYPSGWRSASASGPSSVTVKVSTPRQKSGCAIISAMCSSVKSRPTTMMLS